MDIDYLVVDNYIFYKKNKFIKDNTSTEDFINKRKKDF